MGHVAARLIETGTLLWENEVRLKDFMSEDPLQRLRGHLRLAQEGKSRALHTFRMTKSRHSKISEAATAKADLLMKAIQSARKGGLNHRKIRAFNQGCLRFIRASLENLQLAVGSHKSIDFWDGQIMMAEIAIAELERDRAIRYQIDDPALINTPDLAAAT